MRWKALFLILVAVGGGAAVSIGISQNRDDKSNKVEDADRFIHVFLAARDLQAGERLTSQSVRLEKRVPERVPNGALLRLAELEGCYLNHAVAAGEPLLVQSLAKNDPLTRQKTESPAEPANQGDAQLADEPVADPPAEGPAPSSENSARSEPPTAARAPVTPPHPAVAEAPMTEPIHVPQGFRVCTVPALAAAEHVIGKGCRVDLLLVRNDEPRSTARTVVSDIEVVAWNSGLFEPPQEPASDGLHHGYVSLLVRTDHVPAVVYATQLGELKLALRESRQREG